MLNLRPKFVASIIGTQGSIKVPKGAIVEIKCKKNELRVRNLSSKALFVRGDRTDLSLYAGQEFAAGENLHLDLIAKRKIQYMTPNQMVSDFSIISLLEQEKIMHLVRRSQSHLHKRLFKEIAKTAAALTIVTARHGPFSENTAKSRPWL